MDVALWEFTMIYSSKISSGLAEVWHGVQVVDGIDRTMGRDSSTAIIRTKTWKYDAPNMKKCHLNIPTWGGGVGFWNWIVFPGAGEESH